jgi:hypothetical protein
VTLALYVCIIVKRVCRMNAAPENTGCVCFCTVKALFSVMRVSSPLSEGGGHRIFTEQNVQFAGACGDEPNKTSIRWRMRRHAEQNIQFAGACGARPNKTFN